MPPSEGGPLSPWDLERIARLTRLRTSEVRRICEAREKEYREKRIVSESGKERLLHVPSRSLKLVQKRILKDLLGRLHPHESSACVRGRGTHWAYQRHSGHPALLRLDIADFFPSVPEDQLLEGLNRLGATPALSKTLSGLVMLPGGIPQGAPTSVAVADIVLFPLDIRLGGLARRNGLTYTRYVDDITLSGGLERIRRLEKTVRKVVAELGWSLNDKGGVVGPGERHDLLGAVVNQRPNVSREYFGTVRSYLRSAAGGGTRLDASELRTLVSRAQWIVSVNPERERVLGPLMVATNIEIERIRKTTT